MFNTFYEAVKTFGKDSQVKMAIEEMSELTKELCKNFRGSDNVDHIAEEIADVLIMMTQLEIIFDCYDKMMKFYDEKIVRLNDLIKEVKKNERS